LSLLKTTAVDGGKAQKAGVKGASKRAIMATKLRIPKDWGKVNAREVTNPD